MTKRARQKASARKAKTAGIDRLHAGDGVLKQFLNRYHAFRAATKSRVVHRIVADLSDLSLLQDAVRAQLPEAVEQTEYVGPRDDIERALADIVCAVVGKERVGVHDQFFRLGGDSLKAVQVISRVQRQFETKIPLRAILEHQTVAALAEVIKEHREGTAAAKAKEKLDLVRSLSPEKVRELLAQKRQSSEQASRAEDTSATNASTRVLIIGSTFTSTPIEEALQQALGKQGVSVGIRFAQYAQLHQHLLAPRTLSDENIAGSIILVRVEDWLERAGDATHDLREVEKQLESEVDKFVDQLGQLAAREQPTWIVCCPSRGARSNNVRLRPSFDALSTQLTRTLAAIERVKVLEWSGFARDDIYDAKTDRLGMVPLTQEAFDELGEFLAENVGGLLLNSKTAQPLKNDGLKQLAEYLQSLSVNVELKQAALDDSPEIERLLLTVSAFNLNGAVTSPEEVQRVVAGREANYWLIYVWEGEPLYGASPSGVLLTSAQDDTLAVKSFVLSCPVLGKQVEYAVVKGLAQIATTRGCGKVQFAYNQSRSNDQMLKFLAAFADEHQTDSGKSFTLAAAEIDSRVQRTALAPNAFSCIVTQGEQM